MSHLDVRPSLRLLIVVAFIVSSGVMVLKGTSAHGTMPEVGAPGPGDTDAVDRCASGPKPQGAFDLGPSFAGLTLVDESTQCSAPDLPAGVTVEGGPPPGTSFVSAIYGSCDAHTEADCPYPLEIQSWPECARNLSAYTGPSDPADEDQPSSGPAPDDPHYQAGPGATSEDGDTAPAPWDAYTIVGHPDDLPAVSFEGGTRIEIFTGATTVVVFSDSVRRADRVATALMPALVTEAAQSPPDQLWPRALGQIGGC